MTYTTITTKVVGSTNNDAAKILATDVNQIIQAIQVGSLDIKPFDIQMEGNEITADGGQSWIRRSGNKFQYYDSATWKEIANITNTATFTAGEDIAIRDVVYLDSSDNKIYKASTSNTDWIGIAFEAITSASTGQVYLNGSVVGGFTGLTPGAWQGLSGTDGAIQATYVYTVGLAITATQLILNKVSYETYNQYDNSKDELGEIKQFALSMTGAVTKASLQGRGWAICDGTTPADQGISSPTIATTPNLQEKFIRGSSNETTGGTGGASTVTLDTTQIPAHTHAYYIASSTSPGSAAQYGGSGSSSLTTGSAGGGLAHENKPPYYDIVYFIKVKIV